MAIKGYLSYSFLDWRGQLCGVLFTGGCNLHCWFCHNTELAWQPERFKTLDLKDILTSISQEKRKWIDCMTITGGEPTLDPCLLDYIKSLKSEGFMIKLDTNGTNPKAIEQALPLVDVICMSIKAPLDEYEATVGPVDIQAVKNSIELLRASRKASFVVCATPKTGR